jgi:hypothetical protein
MNFGRTIAMLGSTGLKLLVEAKIRPRDEKPTTRQERGFGVPASSQHLERIGVLYRLAPDAVEKSRLSPSLVAASSSPA